MASRRNTRKGKALKIAEVLKDGLKGTASDAKVLVRRGYGRNFWVWVISEKWRGISRSKRLDAANRALFHGLQDDYDLFTQITLLFCLTPEEYEDLKSSPYHVEESQSLVKE
jgi:acid stress-induced BolA-like protein IbaG/YrbA